MKLPSFNRNVVLFALVVGVIVCPIAMYIGTVNSYSKLEVKAKAVQTDNKNVLDNTRKKIREAAAVSDKEVEALVQVIQGYAGSRGKNPDGKGAAISLASVTEAVPSITEVKTLTNLQNIVTAGRADWQNAQTRLIEVKRQADVKLVTFPSGFILGIAGKEELDIQIITSTETEQDFATGKDDGNWLSEG